MLGSQTSTRIVQCSDYKNLHFDCRLNNGETESTQSENNGNFDGLLVRDWPIRPISPLCESSFSQQAWREHFIPSVYTGVRNKMWLTASFRQLWCYMVVKSSLRPSLSISTKLVSLSSVSSKPRPGPLLFIPDPFFSFPGETADVSKHQNLCKSFVSSVPLHLSDFKVCKVALTGNAVKNSHVWCKYIVCL